MGQCGCGDWEWLCWWESAGLYYAVEVKEPCVNCETPAGVVITCFKDGDTASEHGVFEAMQMDLMPKAGMPSAELAIPVVWLKDLDTGDDYDDNEAGMRLATAVMSARAEFVQSHLPKTKKLEPTKDLGIREGSFCDNCQEDVPEADLSTCEECGYDSLGPCCLPGPEHDCPGFEPEE